MSRLIPALGTLEFIGTILLIRAATGMIKRAGESNKPGARDVCGAGAGEKFGFYQGELE